MEQTNVITGRTNIVGVPNVITGEQTKKQGNKNERTKTNEVGKNSIIDTKIFANACFSSINKINDYLDSCEKQKNIDKDKSLAFIYESILDITDEYNKNKYAPMPPRSTITSMQIDMDKITTYVGKDIFGIIDKIITRIEGRIDTSNTILESVLSFYVRYFKCLNLDQYEIECVKSDLLYHDTDNICTIIRSTDINKYNGIKYSMSDYSKLFKSICSTQSEGNINKDLEKCNKVYSHSPESFKSLIRSKIKCLYDNFDKINVNTNRCMEFMINNIDQQSQWNELIVKYGLLMQISMNIHKYLNNISKQIANEKVKSPAKPKINMDMTEWTDEEMNNMKFLPKSLGQLTHIDEDTHEQTYNKQDIIKLVAENPFKDGVIKLRGYPIRNKGKKGILDISKQNTGETYIAGSSIVNEICKKMLTKDQWSSNDVDIFILGCESHARLKFSEGIDMVYMKEKDIKELLLNFDLPICRAGIDFKGNMYVSIQCLASIFTGKYYMPKYVKDNRKFTQLLVEHHPDGKEKNTAAIIKYWISRFNERVKKYTSRGFSPIYLETDCVIRWIKHRFDYARETIHEKLFDGVETLITLTNDHVKFGDGSIKKFIHLDDSITNIMIKLDEMTNLSPNERVIRKDLIMKLGLTSKSIKNYM